MTQSLAGNHVSKTALHVLKDLFKVDPAPHFRISRKEVVEPGQPADVLLRKLQHVEPSFEQAAKLRIADDFKEHVCEVSEYRYNEEYVYSR